mmetsp:Transcript_31453/g.79982  ORF Transcript_31453/g.79982 Transcript_31453/m.79982 type:complete len:417 (-) Transcript_31453:1792-3042(-)
MSFHPENCSAWPGCVPVRMQLGFSDTFFITFLRPLSMSRNILASAGSCLWMSGAEKMGSRYIQFFCTLSHSSRTFWRERRLPSIFSTSGRMPATKREARMVPIVTIESSSSAWISSMPARMKTSLASLKLLSVNSALTHEPLTLPSISSSTPSCVASVDTRWMSSRKFIMFLASSDPSVKGSSHVSASRSRRKPTIVSSFSQCLSWREGFLRSPQAGMRSFHTAAISRSLGATGLSGSSLSARVAVLNHFCTCASQSLTGISITSTSFHPSVMVVTSLRASHMPALRLMSPTTSSRRGYLSTCWPKTCWKFWFFLASALRSTACCLSSAVAPSTPSRNSWSSRRVVSSADDLRPSTLSWKALMSSSRRALHLPMSSSLVLSRSSRMFFICVYSGTSIWYAARSMDATCTECSSMSA